MSLSVSRALCREASCSLLHFFLGSFSDRILLVSSLCAWYAAAWKKVFYTDDRQGRPAKQDSASVCTCVCVCVYTCLWGEKRGWRTGKEGGGDRRRNRGRGKVKECHCSSVPVYHPLLSCSYKSNRTESLLALRHDTDHWHTEHCQNHLDG